MNRFPIFTSIFLFVILSNLTSSQGLSSRQSLDEKRRSPHDFTSVLSRLDALRLLGNMGKRSVTTVGGLDAQQFFRLMGKRTAEDDALLRHRLFRLIGKRADDREPLWYRMYHLMGKRQQGLSDKLMGDREILKLMFG